MTTNETIAYLKQVVEMEQQLMQLRVVEEELFLQRYSFASGVSYQMQKEPKHAWDSYWLDKPFSVEYAHGQSHTLTNAKNQVPNLYAIKGASIQAPTGLYMQEKFFLENYKKPQFDKTELQLLMTEPRHPVADVLPKKNYLERWVIWLVGILCILPFWLIAISDSAYLLLAITFTVMGSIFILITDADNKGKKQQYEQQQKAKQDYEQAVILRKNAMSCLEQAFASAAEKATKAYCAFAKQRNKKIMKEEDKVRSLIEDAEQTLQKLYNQDIIHAKYRNLAACCMFLEYLESGRCNALTGANGAYNLYESELRQNLIIYKLDEVVQRLDTLQSTMYRCCQAIETVSRKLDVIHSDLQKLNTKAQTQLELSSLTAVYAAATAANTSAIKYLTLIN